jgi:hypothetical protein
MSCKLLYSNMRILYSESNTSRRMSSPISNVLHHISFEYLMFYAGYALHSHVRSKSVMPILQPHVTCSGVPVLKSR